MKLVTSEKSKALKRGRCAKEIISHQLAKEASSLPSSSEALRVIAEEHLERKVQHEMLS